MLAKIQTGKAVKFPCQRKRCYTALQCAKLELVLQRGIPAGRLLNQLPFIYISIEQAYNRDLNASLYLNVAKKIGYPVRCNHNFGAQVCYCAIGNIYYIIYIYIYIRGVQKKEIFDFDYKPRLVQTEICKK